MLKRRKAFFLQEKLEGNQSQNKNREADTDRLDLTIYAMAKKINMPTIELNNYTISEFVKIWDRYNGNQNNQNKSEQNVVSSKKEVEKFLLGR